ncbi:MAG: hypothetical protein WCF48_13515, partial [Terriglobales bacterium]
FSCQIVALAKIRTAKMPALPWIAGKSSVSEPEFPGCSRYYLGNPAAVLFFFWSLGCDITPLAARYALGWEVLVF